MLRIPISTYRVQLNYQFGFRQAHELVEYLQDLGVTDAYASPVFQARRKSLHGYDVVDPTRVNSELGGEEEFVRWAQCLRRRDMGLILDVVPNHMEIADSENRWWMDVLENGPASPHAQTFDIDWNPPKADLRNKVLLPVLGDLYGKVLESGQIVVKFDDGRCFAEYGTLRLPLAARSWNRILKPALNLLRDHENDPEVVELESISTALRHLDPSNYTEYQREKEVTRRRLSAVGPRVHRAIQESLSVLNAHVDQLEPLLDEQPYRLSYWRVAADELNYRPFFDIYDLAAIRVEDPRVFAEVHRRIVPWARGGLVTGLRVDHIDGLRDPEGYVRSLRDACGDCAVFVEKILMQDEALRPEWDVQGTTGYEFANLVNGLYVNPQNRKAFRELYARFTGSDRDFSDVLYESKQLIVRRFMWAEVHTLARALDRISERHRMTRDFTLNSLQEALAEVIACFPVYRTYIRGTPVSAEDRESIQTAIRAAKRRNPATPTPIFDFVSSVLLVEEADDERMEFVFRFQQLTGPVMAKGLEDTAFYRFYPLASLNEVGGNPEIFGIPIERFHRKNQERAASRPHGLSATSTHDTKRSEDVRARLNVLSEIPAEWERTLLRWREMNAALKTNLGGAPVPDANEEYLLYQTLVGTWEGGGDEYVSRIQAYMNKALKEAKLHTSWINPNEAYDRAVQEFVAAVLHSPFAADLNEFVSSRIARPGMLNSLSQTFLKIASPGTPDFYQGTELWDFSLVDPDNRRPVDYARRRELLAAVRREPNPASLLENDRDGRIKLFVIHRALEFRRQRRELFLQGQYRPLECDSARVCAFARTLGGEAVIAAAGRFFASAEDWGPSALSGVEPGTYRDIFTGRTFEAAQGTLRVADIFSPLPLSLLERSD